MSFLSSAANTYKQQAASSLANAAQGVVGAAMAQLSAWGISAPIGSLGEIVFEVSSRRVLTFDGYKRNTKARYASHEVIGQSPVLEFLGPDGEEVSFFMQFRADLGISPRESADRLREMSRSGEASYFLLGNAVIGENMWVVTDVGEDNVKVDHMGRIILNQVSVTLREYVANIR